MAKQKREVEEEPCQTILQKDFLGALQYILYLLLLSVPYFFFWPGSYIRLYNDILKGKESKDLGAIGRFIHPFDTERVRPKWQVEVQMVIWMILLTYLVRTTHDEYVYGSNRELALQQPNHGETQWVESTWVQVPLSSVFKSSRNYEEMNVNKVLDVSEAYFPMHIAFHELGCTIRVEDPLDGRLEERHALHNVTGAIQPGRITGILGPSGSGKSTLAAAILGRTKRLCYKSHGTVFLNGRPRSLEAFLDRLSFVPQHEILHAELTVEETLLFNARLRLPLATTEDQRVQLVNQTIHTMGLDDVRASRVGSVLRRGLSGGERKRLSVAKELIARPSVLVLDEPTTGLDASAAYQLMQALTQVASSGVSVVAILHHPSARMFRLLDDVILLQGGSAVFVGPREELVPYFFELGFGRVDRGGLGSVHASASSEDAAAHRDPARSGEAPLLANPGPCGDTPGSEAFAVGGRRDCSGGETSVASDCSGGETSVASDCSRGETSVASDCSGGETSVASDCSGGETSVVSDCSGGETSVASDCRRCSEGGDASGEGCQRAGCSERGREGLETHGIGVASQPGSGETKATGAPNRRIVMSTAEYIMDILAGDVEYPVSLSNPRYLYALARKAKTCSELLVEDFALSTSGHRAHKMPSGTPMSNDEVVLGAPISQTWLVWVSQLGASVVSSFTHTAFLGFDFAFKPTTTPSAKMTREEASKTLAECIEIVEANIKERGKSDLFSVWLEHPMAVRLWDNIQTHMSAMQQWERGASCVSSPDAPSGCPDTGNCTKGGDQVESHCQRRGKEILESCNAMTNTVERSFCLIQYGMRSRVPFRRVRPGSYEQIGLWFFNDLSIFWRKGVLAHLVATVLLAGVAGFVRSYNNAWSQRSLSNLLISLALSLLGSVGAIFDEEGTLVTRAVNAGILMGTHHWSGVLLCMVRGIMLAHVFAVTFHVVVWARTGLHISSSRSHYFALVYILFLNYTVSNATGYLIKEVTMHHFASANILAVANLIGCHVFAYYSPNRNQVDNASMILGKYDSAWLVHWCCTFSYARYFLELLTLWESKDEDQVGRSFVLRYFGYKQENKSICQSIIWGMTWWIQWVRAVTFAFINLSDFTLVYEIPVFLQYLSKAWLTNVMVTWVVLVYEERDYISNRFNRKHELN